MSNRHALRCDYCGRFFPDAECEYGGGAAILYIPDSHFSCEEIAWACAGCAEKHGPPISKQTGIDSRPFQGIH
jgi:hypothetical protein